MDKPKTYNEWHSSLQGFEGLRHANCCKISYEAGQQSRQAEVDFLKAQLGIKRDQIKSFESEIKQTWQALEEKDKRIEEALAVVERYRDKRYPFNVFCNPMEKALRGEHEA